MSDTVPNLADSLSKSLTHESRRAPFRNEGDVWRTAIEVPVGAELEYKLVHVPATAAPLRWEDGDNHSIKVDLEARAAAITFTSRVATQSSPLRGMTMAYLQSLVSPPFSVHDTLQQCICRRLSDISACSSVECLSLQGLAEPAPVARLEVQTTWNNRWVLADSYAGCSDLPWSLLSGVSGRTNRLSSTRPRDPLICARFCARAGTRMSSARCRLSRRTRRLQSR